MSHHEDLPGVVPAGGPDPKLEWVQPDRGVLGALQARVGSDPRAEELLLAVMRVLRGALPHDTWEGVVEELPYPVRAALHGDALAGTRPLRGGPIEAVASAIWHPVPRTRLRVRAVLASLAASLPRGLCDAIAAELTGELAELWRAAR